MRADRLETSGFWRRAHEYPLPGASEQVLHLCAAGALAADAPQPGGSTESEASDPEPAGEAFDAFEYRPTVGIAGGLRSGGVPFGLPTDQRPDELHALTYTTAPLDAPLEIAGWPRTVLHVRSTAPVMAFVARLCDVAPPDPYG